MNNLIRTFLQSLHDRVIGSIGSLIGTSFSTFHALQQAEQISFLEDLARQYEADGKTDLAKQVRLKATNLNADDPASEALPVFRNLLADQHRLPLLENDPGHDSLSSQTKSTSAIKKKSRTRRPASPTDDMGVSLD